MTSLDRRQFLKVSSAACGAAALGWSGVSNAADFNYKIATNLPATHPLNIRLKEACDKILAESSGKVAIQLYPNNQLGSDTDMLSQVRSGGVEFFTLSGLILANLVPEASISGVGFAFNNYDTLWSAMDGDLGRYIRDRITKANLVVMDKVWDNGFRQITTGSKVIKAPADLAGVKLRVPPNQLWITMFKALGAAPTPLNFAELYSALQTKVVEGQENPLPIVETSKLYEVQKYCAITNHMWDGFWLLSNRKAFERLPENLREVVRKNFNAAAEAERRDVASLNTSLQASLQQKGMQFTQPDSAQFKNQLRAANFYAELKNKYSPEAWALLERYSGKLA